MSKRSKNPTQKTIFKKPTSLSRRTGTSTKLAPATHNSSRILPTHLRARMRMRQKLLYTVVFFVPFLTLCGAVPYTRAKVFGLFIQRPLSIIVYEKDSGARVTEADVLIDNVSYATDQTGTLHLTAKPGRHAVTVSKAFYSTQTSVFTGHIFKPNKELTVSLKVHGVPIKATVKNRIDGRPLAGVLITSRTGAKARTSKDGTAHLVLPLGTTETDGSVSLGGVKKAEVILRAADDDHTNVFMALPDQRIYYLGSGKPDVVSTYLDGSDPQVVVAATGQEDSTDTELIASPNWQYLALKSRREGETKLYIYSTKNNTLQTIDQSASFSLTGWLGSSFVYRTELAGAPLWQSKRMALKSYDAAQGLAHTLDESKAEGKSVLDFVGQTFKQVYLADGRVLYTQHWTSSYYYGGRYTDKYMTLMSVKPDGSDAQPLYKWQAGYDARIDSRPNSAQEVYIHVELTGVQHSYWRYYKGKVEPYEQASDTFLNGSYATYYVSPNTSFVLWAQTSSSVGGLFIGDYYGQNGKQLTNLVRTVPKGWFTDGYVLAGQTSELYITGRATTLRGLAPIKVTGAGSVSYAIGAHYGK